MLAHLFLTAVVTLLGTAQDPAEAAVNALLEADRGFATAAAGRPPAEAIPAMFADNVMMPAPGFVFAKGKAKATDAMKQNPDNLAGTVEWAPVRGGISGDGTQGFTFGYMTQTKADGTQVPWKYLAYWVKGPEGWRVAAYRRSPRAQGTVSTEMVPPSLPRRLQAPITDPRRITHHEASLAAAEKAFSDEAQKVGLGAAFAKNGRADAVNMGGPKAVSFVVGAEAIGRAVGEGSPTDRSEVEWSADRVLVASSGDLGITFGMIRFHEPKKGQPAAVPFFTIWRRDDTSLPWRYIAE